MFKVALGRQMEREFIILKFAESYMVKEIIEALKSHTLILTDDFESDFQIVRCLG